MTKAASEIASKANEFAVELNKVGLIYEASVLEVLAYQLENGEKTLPVEQKV
jgi:hypothetical protein